MLTAEKDLELKNTNTQIIQIETGNSQNEIDKLRDDILSHFNSLNLPALNGKKTNETLSKDNIRFSHSNQKYEIHKRQMKVLGPHLNRLISQFALGKDVIPELISPYLIPVNSEDDTGLLFRLATLLWSVPVSQGYGRRMRFLVKDRYNDRLIGIFALGDPVFNLRCRDIQIGWGVNDRRNKLVNVMDAYVVGAVPPYNYLLGGKLVASLMCSSEVNNLFFQKYKDKTGVISHKQKNPQLVLITVTSALGRSSIYNRLNLSNDGKPIVSFKKIGETKGYGHFQISDELFHRLRLLLAAEDHPYANGNRFGNGPNWKLRVTRVGLERLSLDSDLVFHGIHREVYMSTLAQNYQEYLKGCDTEPMLSLATVNEISQAALRRWIIPRANRNHDWMTFNEQDLLKLLGDRSEENDEIVTPSVDSRRRLFEEN